MKFFQPVTRNKHSRKCCTEFIWEKYRLREKGEKGGSYGTSQVLEGKKKDNAPFSLNQIKLNQVFDKGLLIGQYNKSSHLIG